MAERSSRDAARIFPGVRAASTPLSFAQQRLWLLDQLEPTSWAYNVSIVRRLRGSLDVHALQLALDELVARHEVLRTTFPAVDGNPVQVVAPPAPFELTVVDLSDRAPAEAEAEVTRLAVVETRRWFDLARGPVFRGLLIKLSLDDHLLTLSMHHIITDAWSEAIVLDELSALYNAFARGEPSSLEPLPIQYADYAAWQRTRIAGAALQAQLNYWQERLESLPSVLELPADRPRPARRSGRGEVIELELAAPLVAGLRQISREGRATLFMTLLAAFQVLLARYSGEDDIAIGTAIANRTRLETAGLIGFFANTLVLRTDLSDDPTFMDVLDQVRAIALGAYGHQDLPFEHVVKALAPERTLSHTSLFQHMFVFQNAPVRDLTLDGVVVSRFALAAETAMFDLTLQLSEAGDVLAGSLEYATDIYDRATAERFVDHFRNLLEAVVADPRQPISAPDLLGDDERHRLMDEWNETGAAFPAERCIHELFDDQVALHPDAVAITDGDVSLTYRELEARANRLANHLRSMGVGPEARVGILLPRSDDAVVALLATLKAGGAYLPLDPEYPTARLTFMLDDGDVHVVVTEAAVAERLGASRARLVCVDRDATQIASAAAERPVSGATAGNLAYIVYTSGSTGTPKGVMIEHRAVVALLFGVDYIRFDEVDALLHMAPLAFDASTFEIWGALLHGRRCVVYSDRHFSLERFGALLRSESIDTLWLTSSLFNVVIDQDWRHLTGVRQLIIGGEALSPAHVANALRLLPGLRLVNGYGPTEATTFAACHEIRALDVEAGPVPIGRPTANTELYILDSNRRPLPIGVGGELYIGGAGLARGYLDRSELTAERFVSHPFDSRPNARLYRTGDLARYRADGNVEFLGRVDDQVKIRGFRVEPGEVEAVLNEHPDVAGAAVLVRENNAGQRRLVAYVARSGAARPSDDLHGYLRSRLPDYLVPAAIVAIDALPLSQNGKVDRAALLALGEAPAVGTTYVAPTTAMERAHAAIWTEVLGVERVGIDDDFFSLGGDSLLAAVLFAKTARLTGRTIPLSLMFAGPTIRAVAEAFEANDAQEETSLVPLRSTGTKPPIIVAHGVSGLLFRYANLVRRLDPEQPVYGLSPTASVVAGTRHLRMEDLARRYVADILELQPTGPYYLAGFCFGGIVVMEVAYQLESLGHTVGVLALFDAEASVAPPLSRSRREAAQLASLARREESVSGYLRRRFGNVRAKLRRAPWLADHWLHLRTGRPLSKRWDDVERVQAVRAFPLQRLLGRALDTYVAPDTICTVTTFRAGDSTVETTLIRFEPGDERDGDSYVIDGPGVSHDTLMDEPYVGALANALTERIDRVRAAAEASAYESRSAVG